MALRDFSYGGLLLDAAVIGSIAAAGSMWLEIILRALCASVKLDIENVYCR
jgi:hypothetical protein